MQTTDFSTRQFGRIVRCKEGVTTIEFAMIVPVLMLIMMGIVEFALIMFTMSAMESATNTTSRMGKTGYAAPGSTREEQLIASVKNRTANLLDPNLIQITSKVYPNFGQVGQPEPYVDTNHNGIYNSGEPYTDSNGNGSWDSDVGVAGVGGAGDIVLYSVTYPWPIFTPFIGAIIGNPFNITVRTVVKNEPF